MMTQQHNIPDGYGVLHADDGYYYPVEITRYYSADDPQISLSVMILWSPSTYEARYKQRKDAVAHTRDDASRETAHKRWLWEQVTIGSDVYPERCSHYLDEIEAITGVKPYVRRGYESVSVWVPPYKCACGLWQHQYEVYGLSIEEALEDAAQHVYAHQCLIERVWQLAAA